MDTIKIGLFLQGLRKQKNMTQLDLANQLNVTHQTVSKWENGDSLPDITTLQQLAKYYSISIEEILQGELNKQVKIEEPKADHNKTWIVMRLACSLMIFISLFLNYASQSFEFMTFGSPFDNMAPKYIYRGFNLIFDASELTFFTGGAWLIFLAILALNGLYGVECYKTFSNQYLLFKDENTLMIKKIIEIVLSIGFGFILIGTIFNGSVELNFGYFIGLILTIALHAINYYEQKKPTNNY